MFIWGFGESASIRLFAGHVEIVMCGEGLAGHGLEQMVVMTGADM